VVRVRGSCNSDGVDIRAIQQFLDGLENGDVTVGSRDPDGLGSIHIHDSSQFPVGACLEIACEVGSPITCADNGGPQGSGGR
jgi:hypothetical protein